MELFMKVIGSFCIYIGIFITVLIIMIVIITIYKFPQLGSLSDV